MKDKLKELGFNEMIFDDEMFISNGDDALFFNLKTKSFTYTCRITTFLKIKELEVKRELALN